VPLVPAKPSLAALKDSHAPVVLSIGACHFAGRDVHIVRRAGAYSVLQCVSFNVFPSWGVSRTPGGVSMTGGGCQEDTGEGVSLTPSAGQRVRSGATHEPEARMTIPNNPLEHPRDPDRRCNVLVSTRGPKFSASILKGACLRGEMPARGHHQVVERVVAERRSQSRLAAERLGSGRHCRVLAKTGTDNHGFLALSGTELSRGQAEKERIWFP
jgi:hypothetical protein